MDDKLSIARKIIKTQDELIDNFDQWVRKIKLNDLEAASDIVKEANKLRAEIIILKKQLDKKVILLN